MEYLKRRKRMKKRKRRSRERRRRRRGRAKCLEGNCEGGLVKERSKRARGWDSVSLRHGLGLDSTFGSVGNS